MDGKQIKVSVEIINNKPVTIIRKPFDAEWVREQLDIGNPIRVEHYLDKKESGLMFEEDYGDCAELPEYWRVIERLPSLPKHPTKDDAGLLYEYMAKGMSLHFTWLDAKKKLLWQSIDFPVNQLTGEVKISHATDTNGEPIEIAIEGE